MIQMDFASSIEAAPKWSRRLRFQSPFSRRLRHLPSLKPSSARHGLRPPHSFARWRQPASWCHSTLAPHGHINRSAALEGNFVGRSSAPPSQRPQLRSDFRGAPSALRLRSVSCVSRYDHSPLHTASVARSFNRAISLRVHGDRQLRHCSQASQALQLSTSSPSTRCQRPSCWSRKARCFSRWALQPLPYSPVDSRD